MLNNFKEQAQEILEQLNAEHLLPFALTAREVETLGNGEFIVRFHDSRLHCVDLTWHDGDCFAEIFRVAILKRVSRLMGVNKFGHPHKSSHAA